MTEIVQEPQHQAQADVGRVRQRTQWWGAVALGLALAALGVGVVLSLGADEQDDRIDTLAQVVAQQNALFGEVCQIAGGQVDAARPAARTACERVERGEPAVPIPAVATGEPGTDGAPGVGVSYTRQIDRCYIEVGLSNGASSRFGSFCGADGQVGPTGSPGPTGPTGPTGVSGQPGVDGDRGDPGVQGARGVGIADVRRSANPCFVDVVLDDAASTVRTVGPFCGPPVGEYTVEHADGSAERCARDGGADTAPNYRCVLVAPTVTTTVAPTTTTTEDEPLLPLPTG